jgi:hypothetical protein
MIVLGAYRGLRANRPGSPVRVADVPMPSLLRFLAVIGVIAGIGYGIVFSLAHFVDPKPREISVTVPPDRFYKQR